MCFLAYCVDESVVFAEIKARSSFTVDATFVSFSRLADLITAHEFKCALCPDDAFSCGIQRDAEHEDCAVVPEERIAFIVAKNLGCKNDVFVLRSCQDEVVANDLDKGLAICIRPFLAGQRYQAIRARVAYQDFVDIWIHLAFEQERKAEVLIVLEGESELRCCNAVAAFSSVSEHDDILAVQSFHVVIDGAGCRDFVEKKKA